VKKAKFVLDFGPQSPLRRRCYETEQHVGNLKYSLEASMIPLQIHYS